MRVLLVVVCIVGLPVLILVLKAICYTTVALFGPCWVIRCMFPLLTSVMRRRISMSVPISLPMILGTPLGVLSIICISLFGIRILRIGVLYVV